MVRVPGYYHRESGALPVPFGPTRSAARPPTIPMGAYTRLISGIPLTGGQAQGVVGASGTITLSVGPSGIGTVWYPAQATVTTTTGVLDTSTCLLALGPVNIPVTTVAQVFTGNGTAALAIPSMTPGQFLIARWTSAHVGDLASVNIIGTMAALSP